MLNKVPLLAVIPVLVLALTGCSNSAEPKTTALTDTPPAAPTEVDTPQTGTLDTSIPTFTPPPPIKASDLIKAKGAEHSFVKASVETLGFTKSQQTEALDFARDTCSDIVEYDDDLGSALSAAEGDGLGTYDGTDLDTESQIGQLAQKYLCPDNKMNAVTKRYLKGENLIRYTVTSSSGVASMTWDDGGTIGQANDHALPWSKSFDAGQETSVSAQNGGGGTITCTTTDGNGKFQNRHKSTGAFAIVDC